MPSSMGIQLPRAKDAYEFESMVASVCSVKYGLQFQKYGRSGQKQDGIDLYSGVDGNIVIQCKNYQVSVNELQKIISKVTVGFPFQKLIVATSGSADVAIQNYLIQLNLTSGLPPSRVL